MINNNVLLFGIGNCGREDDGLGWAFLDKIKPLLPNNFDTEYRYQLQVEDAELATQYQTVIFIDAHKTFFKKGFMWEKCYPKAADSYTSHELNPQSVLHLTSTIYNKHPKSFTLGITGKTFCLSIGLSEAAKLNLASALDFFEKKVLNLVN
ncbi:hydrogenase maturation protease [Lutibacter sp.]